MVTMPLGVYISVPFCRTKCSYCNFASGVFSKEMFGRYTDRVCSDIAHAEQIAADMGGRFLRDVDSIYLGGGTPTVLAPEQLERIFGAIRKTFQVSRDAEITVECAPGTLQPDLIEPLLRCGVNRVSLGVQSFIDAEAHAVGRLHTREKTLDDIARLRGAGITNINIDLIAGLPHQTPESWRRSLEEVIATGVPHVSVYMLEVDEDSRLGRELIAGGTRYHAHFVPDDDTTADLYVEACHRFSTAGVPQYEISNFARPGFESRHNLKYWTRQPYMGFGVDAHSMLLSAKPRDRRREEQEIRQYLEHAPNFVGPSLLETQNFFEYLGEESVRFSSPDSLDEYLGGAPLARTSVSYSTALEEAWFLGLRMNRGVRPAELAERFGPEGPTMFREVIAELRGLNLLEFREGAFRLTERGRLLSNEVFQKFLGAGAEEPANEAS